MNSEMIQWLQLKDSDMRLDCLWQCRHAIDGGIHIGGAYSALLPLVALYYGGYIDVDVTDPTRNDKDQFILSKGHAVAALASIYADLGYIEPDMLKNSRSFTSDLNGHPGPILPGIPISTGPLGQGLSAGCGFAEQNQNRDVYCMTGDGELQEGSNWEAILYAGSRGLSNLCLIVDKNNGCSDDTGKLLISLGDLKAKLEAFGWQVFEADATRYDSMIRAYEDRRQQVRDGRPTAVICHSRKGFGGFSSVTCSHKSNLPPEVLATETRLQEKRRTQRLSALIGRPANESMAKRMHYEMEKDAQGNITKLTRQVAKAQVEPAAKRDKKIRFREEDLPVLDRQKQYQSDEIAGPVMQVLAQDEKIVTIDADLSSTSGLQGAVAKIDQGRALNAGIAESLMMCMGEAWAAAGYNVWVSTFCVFFDWRALRRIAVSHQERLESIAKQGWLSEGHALDLTFWGTAANIDTQTNGATHMGTDDLSVFAEIPNMKIIDVSCPQQLMAVMRWIAAGGRGLVYVRVMRAKSAVLYEADYQFEYGKATFLYGGPEAAKIILSSGRGVHEALAAAQGCTDVAVVDMPSIDEDLLRTFLQQDKELILAEQNNGFIAPALSRLMLQQENKVTTINTRGKEPRFVHSGTYAQITKAFGFDAESLRHRLS